MDPRHIPDRYGEPGPFYSSQLPTESNYELVNGHPVLCSPVGLRHSSSATRGAELLDTDPAVEAVGVEAGFALDGKNVRAPDVSIVPTGQSPGWIHGAPPLALEMADDGQDERDLQAKIAELLARGTRFVWVVRLSGPPRVEVYTPDGLVALARPGHMLEAPGILQNPVPVSAFYDRALAHEVTLRNLLNRLGYQDLDEVRARSRSEGKAEGTLKGRVQALRLICQARGLPLDPAAEARIDACQDLAALDRWIAAAATAEPGSPPALS